MELTYDPKYNIAYICLRSKKSEVESIKISEELIVDIGSDGTVYGIEFLNANEQIRREGQEEFVIYNKLSGKKLSVPLPV